MADNTVTERYALKWDELNTLETQLSVGGFVTSDAKQKFEDMLLDAYIEGFAAVEFMLGEEIDTDDAKITEAVQKSYDGVSIYTKFEDYYRGGDEARLRVLMDSEFHRVYGQAGKDAADKLAERGMTVYKVWNTMQDPRVRPSHDYLEGMKVPLSQPFITFDLDEAMFPGGFSLPENNTNCRCYLTYSL